MFLIASSLAITTYFPRVLFNRVDDADDRAVNRRACFAGRGGRSRPALLNDYHNIGLDSVERETGLFAATPEDEFARAGPDRIDCDERFAHGAQIAVEDLNDHQFAAFESGVFDRRDHVSDYAGELHITGP